MNTKHISISHGNSKMGAIPSVSLPAGVTCRACDCNVKCYAKKLERLRPNVRNAYAKNLGVLLEANQTYWREVEAAVMMNRYFRFHVSGDIPDYDYLTKMVGIAERNSHCKILCFTKQYEFINEYLRKFASFPKNLRIIMSAWVGLPMDNPFELPEAHVRYRDKTTTARPDAIHCGGNCTECATEDGGCWNLERGEQVIFDEH